VAALDLVVFDLDGTLVDTIPDIAWALAATLAEIGAPAPPVEVVTQLVGDGSRALIERALPGSGADRDLDALVARFAAHYRAHLSVASRVYPGVPEALAAARGAGLAIAVVTNKLGDLARALLADVGLAEGLLAVIGDGDGFARKPDPAAARDVVARAGTVAARTAVVGDGLPDVRTARALGAVAIAAAWGYVARDRLAAESPDAVAATPDEAMRVILGWR
jgi:phosphoglycolate phosphatase